MQTAETWAMEAGKLPLAFAQTREDPLLDLDVAPTSVARTAGQDAEIMMIVSGGDTIVQLSRLPRLRIHAVDINQAQIALAKCKLLLAKTADAEFSAQLLGHESMDPEYRRRELLQLLGTIGAPPDIFGPLEFVATHGPDHAGRYERCFAQLREVMKELDLGPSLDRVMALPNLVELFGREAAQNPARPFAKHFAKRSRIALARADAETNPFVCQMYRGRFAPGHRYDWLNQCQPQPQSEVIFHHGQMLDMLNSSDARSLGMVHLSNILDWLSPELAQQTLAAAARVLKPGGRLIARQLNSSLRFDTLSDAFKWDRELGAKMVERDRSFFYPMIHLGCRT